MCTPGVDGGVECSCPDDVGLVLKNAGRMCVSAYSNCSTMAGLFTCRSGQCIREADACDGQAHCDDGSVP